MLRWFAPLLYQLPAAAGLICFYGADLEQVGAKDFAKDVVSIYQAANPDAKTGVGTNIAANGMFGDLKTKLAACYDEDTKKFKCDGGALLIYFSSHGNETEDGKDTVIGNPQNPGNIKISEFASQVAAIVRECCTLVFAFDACFADRWYNNFIKPDGDKVNPNDPFKDLNYLVITPKVTEDGKCLGTPVGSALQNAFKDKQKRTVGDLITFLGIQEGLTYRDYLDDQHKGYQLTADLNTPRDPNDPVPVPEPSTLLTTAATLLIAARRRTTHPAAISPVS